MNAEPINPFDIIETPGHSHPRLYQVQGVHLGALDQESVVEISAYDQSAPDAHGEKQSMFVPLEMIQAGVGAGLFTVTKA